jgi:hypothetical protein
MVIDLIFYTGLSLLLTHELDAIKQHEWRIFPGLSNLKDNLSYPLFVILHIPLFILILWLLCHPSEYVQFWFQISVDGFLIIHLGLHHFFKSHDKYEFTQQFSKIIINLMALTGLIHIILLFTIKKA